MDSETTSPKREKGNYVVQDLHVYELPNGLVLLGEIMDWVESAAFTIALPAGCIHDPSDRLGLANFASEMAQRGCGDHDSREFIESLDRLGADRSSSTTQVHTSLFGGNPGLKLRTGSPATFRSCSTAAPS